MRILCRFGFFSLEETSPGQASDFSTLFELPIASDRENRITFQPLVDAPTYCVKGQPYLGTSAKLTFAGHPWEIFDANEFVFSLESGLVVPRAEIGIEIEVFKVGNRFTANGLIQPGSRASFGTILSYTAWYSRARGTWLYSGLGYV